MRRLWRKDGSGITTTARVADAAPAISPVIASQGDDSRLLAFLAQNMAAAIVKAILDEEDTISPP